MWSRWFGLSRCMPSQQSGAAAQRLGWTITKFNRKLDNVCEKLAKLGVRGLHGDASRLATSRKARLVEHALATQLVTEAASISRSASWR